MTKNFSVLLVDDEHDAVDVLAMLLELELPGTSVTVAYGGRDGLAHATAQRPTVAILDLEMPSMDGEALAAALRAHHSDECPILIAASGNIQRVSALRASGPFDHHFSKPVDVGALLGILRRKMLSET